MALFRRDTQADATESSRTPADRARPVTRVAAGTRIEGVIGGAADLVVEGEVEGEIALEATATVAPQGRVVGKIAAHVVQVAGTVEGDVDGRDRVELLPTARLTGDVAAAKVVIAEGAFLKGSVEMRGRPPASTAADEG